MIRPARLEPLGDRALNTNYTPARPWTCQTFAPHTCTGEVIGFVGAYPVCAAGAPAEIEARRVDAERIEAFENTPEARAAAAAEHAWESRVS